MALTDRTKAGSASSGEQGMPRAMRELVRSFRSLLYKRFLFPAVLALRGEYSMYDVLTRLDGIQWDQTERLLKLQREKLRTILNYGYRHVPYYRQRWDEEPVAAGEDPIRAAQSLPFLTKADIQASSDELVSENRPSRFTKKTTGGSTGEPVTVLKDRSAMAQERAASWLAYSWYGVEIGDIGARFWGSPTEFGIRRFRYALADLAMNRVRFSAFAFGERELEAYWERCLRVRPDYFYGYVSMLTEFARYLRDRGVSGDQLGLKAVITTAESLEEPQRELLRRVFEAPVQNEYGCGEVGPVAYQCPNEKMHVMGTNVFVELVDETGRHVKPGQTGEVVLTDLNNRAMPLIRYRVGDRAVQGQPCDCGRSFPVLERIHGRVYDFVQDTRGRRYHGEYFMYLFEDLRDRGAEVSRFRVTQHSRNELTLELVHPDRLSSEDESYLRDRLDRDMPGMKVSLEYVAEIRRASSGKTRVIRNELLTSSD